MSVTYIICPFHRLIPHLAVANGIIVVKNHTDHISPTSKTLCLSFTPTKLNNHKFFEIGIFDGTGPTATVSSSSETPSPKHYPGIPLSPAVLLEKEKVEAFWIELEFESSSSKDGFFGKDDFVATYNDIFPHQMISVKTKVGTES